MRRNKPKKLRPAALTEDQILAWADAYHSLNGTWPKVLTRPQAVQGAPAERWSALDQALRVGCRGLPGGSSLARLLGFGRGLRNPARRSHLTIEQILTWCDEYHKRTAEWPKLSTLPRQSIPGSEEDTWQSVDAALRHGGRGLPGGSSLSRILAEYRGVRNSANLPPLTVQQILKWADEHYERTGQWPKEKNFRDEIPGSAGETWKSLNQALSLGYRGLPHGESLAGLLTAYRGVRHQMRLPRLTVKQILKWADSYHSETGEWPTLGCSAQEIPGTPGEQWVSVDQALRKGLRGLAGGSSLARELAERRGVRNIRSLPRLTLKLVLAWADAFHDQNGQWPTRECSPQLIPGTLGERWCNVHSALQLGTRGFPGGSTLAQLLAQHRGVRNHKCLPRLTTKQILAWAVEFHEQTGEWPNRGCSSHLIPGMIGERWSSLDKALKCGNRGLPGGSSLSKLFAPHRSVPIKKNGRKERIVDRRR